MQKRRREDQNNLKWAQVLLPRLPPPDVASLSSTCKYLLHMARSITIQRASDASRGFEKHPIPFINTVDNKPYSYFIYTPFSILPSSSSSPFSDSTPPPTIENAAGCHCSSNCCAEDGGLECPCTSPEMEFSDDVETMTECGSGCVCGSECVNRSTQGGVSVRLRIVRHRGKGWGLHAAQFLRRGEFICEYAGELLTTEEARRRQQKYDELASCGGFSSALLVVREHLPSGKACLRLNIDATRVGNVARFINHSCDGGNLSSVLVRNSGALLPLLCFFAARDILEGEELAFSYGDVRLRPKGLPCFCASSGCFGVLPSEQT